MGKMVFIELSLLYGLFSVFSSREKVFLRKRKINHDDILIFLNLKKRIFELTF